MMSNDQIPNTVEEIAANIVRRCQTLLQEMGQLRQQLFALHGENQHISGLATHISSIRTEKLAAESFLASMIGHHAPWKGNAEARFRSNNIPAVQQVWNIVKNCRHITAVNHRVAANPRVIGGHEASSGELKLRSKVKPVGGTKAAIRKGTSEDGVWVNAVVDGVRNVLVVVIPNRILCPSLIFLRLNLE